MLTFLLAIENISLILAAPLFSLSVNSAPEAKTNGSPLSLASVLAKSVFPVPGGPESRTPCNSQKLNYWCFSSSNLTSLPQPIRENKSLPEQTARLFHSTALGFPYKSWAHQEDPKHHLLILPPCTSILFHRHLQLAEWTLNEMRTQYLTKQQRKKNSMRKTQYTKMKFSA